jgi:hypothetical protein
MKAAAVLQGLMYLIVIPLLGLGQAFSVAKHVRILRTVPGK